MSYCNNTIVNTSVDVSHFSGLVIGPKGATIKTLKSEHGLKKCFIENGNLVLCGTTSSCAAAKAEVLSIIEQRRYENRKAMDRYAMVAETNLQHKKQLKANKKKEAEARLEAMIQSQIETIIKPTYTYNGKFNFDSDSEDESDEINEPVEQSMKPSDSPDMIVTRNLIMEKEVELSTYSSGCWADAAEIEELETEIAVLKAKLIR